ncbi:hypothetical protein CYK67_09150 [Clostridium perfringens]|nr:hypothetical protein CYK67_09150 [Clostridium perfringens]
MSVPVLLSLILGKVALNFVSLGGFSQIVAEAFIFTIIFIPLMWFMGMNSYEKNLVLNPIKKF